MKLTAKNFTECSQDELRMVLCWRNATTVADNSLDNAEISWEWHCEFVNTLKTASDKAYFVISDGSAHIGVISLRNICEKSAEVGYYKNPALNVKGIGVLLLDFAADKAKNTYGLSEIVTRVIAGNVASEKSIERAGFHAEKDILPYTHNDGRQILIKVYKKVL